VPDGTVTVTPVGIVPVGLDVKVVPEPVTHETEAALVLRHML